MTPAIAALLMQTAGQVVGQGMGLGVGEINNRRNLTQQRKLQNLQIGGQKDLTTFNQEAALKMWKDTNYSAQMEELKKAGLNPGLIYGMTGGGGTTAQVTQGNLSGGHVPAPMGIESGINGAQLALLKSQKELIDAQANKERQTTPGTGQTQAKIGAETSSLLQGIENAKAQQELTEVQTRIAYVKEHVATMTQNQAVQLIQTELKNNLATLSILENEQTISNNTVKQKEGIIRMTYALMIIEQYKKTAETINIDQQTRESINRVGLAIQANMQNWDKLDQVQQGIGLDKAALMGSYENLPQELKALLDNILIIPGLGGKQRPPAVGGFHKR